MVPLCEIPRVLNLQRQRQQISSCQGLGEQRNGKWLPNGCEVSEDYRDDLELGGGRAVQPECGRAGPTIAE